MRIINADDLKELRDKYIKGEINLDYEGDLIDKCPTVDISPIIQYRINEDREEVKARIPTALFDKVSDELMKDQCLVFGLIFSNVFLKCQMPGRKLTEKI